MFKLNPIGLIINKTHPFEKALFSKLFHKFSFFFQGI